MKELLYLKDAQLKDLIEKLFLGYRETFSDSKNVLNKSLRCLSIKKECIIFLPISLDS